MTVLKFAEEFTRLVIHYTRTSSPNNDPLNAVTPLTEGQITFTIHHVLHALAIKGFDDNNNNNNLLEIPSSTNAAIIPETSVVNNKREPDMENTCRSQDVQFVFTDEDSAVSDVSLKTIEKEQENSFNTLQNEKKFISRSNPAICFNNISRSDTFVREGNKKINNGDQGHVWIVEDFLNAKTDDLSCNQLFQKSLGEIRKSAMNIMAKLNNLEQSFPQSIRSPNEDQTKAKVQPNLTFSEVLFTISNMGGSSKSLINDLSSPHRISTVKKTKVPTNIRRSISVYPKTPTKLLATENGNISERRKSTGGIGNNTPIGKSSESKVGHSVSNLTLSASKTLSDSSVEFQPKFTKNPKYAHVRSTIPKAISHKKKIQ